MDESLPKVAAQIRRDLCRHQVSEREHVIVDLLLRLSYDDCREVAKLPNLESFTACTGISKGNVLGVLQRLLEKKILAIVDGGYKVVPRTPDFEWKVSPRMNLKSEETAMVLLKAYQREQQGLLIEREKTLSESIVDCAIEQASGVPESGTVSFPIREPNCSRIGNAPFPHTDRDRVLEKEDRSISREKGVGVARVATGGDRQWLLAKLDRLPRLKLEILKPQNDHQRRMGRLFWELEEADIDWLKDRLGMLVDRTDVDDKAAWFNKSMTNRSAFIKAGKGVEA